MSELSRAGVCYDLAHSPFSTSYQGFTFRFSSYVHKRKYERELRKKVLWITDSISRRFHMSVDMRLMAAVHWYRQIETRGFHVEGPFGETYATCEDFSATVELSHV